MRIRRTRRAASKQRLGRNHRPLPILKMKLILEDTEAVSVTLPNLASTAQQEPRLRYGPRRRSVRSAIASIQRDELITATRAAESTPSEHRVCRRIAAKHSFARTFEKVLFRRRCPSRGCLIFTLECHSRVTMRHCHPTSRHVFVRSSCSEHLRRRAPT
jgi:hypothetical protein